MTNASGSTNKAMVLILIVVMVSAAVFSYLLFLNVWSPVDSNDNNTNPILAVNDAIRIDGDNEFQSYAMEYLVPGNGTVEDPFIIRNLSIVEEGICIDIRNVDLLFIIRDCELKTTADYWGMGLYLKNCDNATIERCRTEGGISGIEFVDCYDVVVQDCFVSASFFGINSSISQRAIIRGNTVFNTTWGITIVGANGTVIESNKISYNELGLTSQFSCNCTLSHSNMTDNKLGVYIEAGCQNWVIHSNRFESNTDGNAKDDGIMNQWDDGISIGNIWDDYSGIGWYSIPGTAGSLDRFPQGL